MLVDSQRECRTFFGDDTPKAGVHYAALPKPPEDHVRAAFGVSSYAALGHRRLSIVDLSFHGHQPMGSEDERYWLVYNGEIYNFSEIAQELEADGIKFRSHSDTEVLLRAYIHWGERCLQKFNGMFAFAVWDQEDRSLFCARDRIGIKPFYHTVQDGQFIFASDIKTIIASGLYSPEPDMEGLYLSMAFGFAPRPKTAFKGIRALEQGHWMRVRANGNITKHRYWSVPIGTQNKRMREQEATELLEDKLTTSIRRRLIADVAVGTFMSGGIDSTTISAIAANLQPGIRAFTLAFEGDVPELDEVAQAQATARMHRMDHVIHFVDPDDALQDLQSWVAGYEEPYFNLAANFVISKRVQDEGVKVVLNGLGGDELFAGYRWYRHINTWRILRLARPFIGRLLSLNPKAADTLRTIASASSADRFHTAFFTKNSDAGLRQLFADPNLQNIRSLDFVHNLYCQDKEFADPVEALSYMDIMNYIGNHHVHRSDQFTMMHSIEGRFPFLDHELVEAAFSIPSHLKIRWGVQKRVLRKVAERYIAPECLSMQKKGFGLPLKQWLRGPLMNLAESKISSLGKRAEIRSDVPKQWLREYQAGRRTTTKIWHLVSLEMWFETFIDRN